MTEPVVAVVGAKALRRDINRLTVDVRSPLYKAISAAGKQAVEPVAAAVRGALPSSDRDTPDAGALAGSVRTSGTRTGGSVRMGTKTVAWAGWVEFGGSRRQPHLSERPFVKSGRYLFPAAQGLAGRAAADYTDALARVFASPGIWTNASTDPEAVHD